MIIGITGHQDLINQSTYNWVRKALSKAIDDYQPQLGISALAVGADQLFSQILSDKGIPFQVVLPCKKYNETFSEKNLANYLKLKKQASKVVQLEYLEPSEEAFWEAGKYLVDHVDVLLAVWNGLPAKGLGGTADVVNYALGKGTKRKIVVLHLNLLTKTTKILNTKT